jgi:alanine racemase
VSSIESFRNISLFTWGHANESNVRLLHVHVEHGHSVMEVEYNGSRFSVEIPFVDRASQENAMQCVAFMLYYGYSEQTIVKRCAKLAPVEMRLEMDEATGNSLLINDSYSLDLNSLGIALDYLGHINQYHNKVLIISDFMQTGLPEGELYSQVAAIVKQRGIKQVICIGEALVRNKAFFNGMEALFYPSTQDFIDNYSTDQLQNSTILLKGARVFGFERIAKLLQKKSHETVMEVNIGALIHNLNYYRAKLKPTTKLMAMVKASSYGAGRVEVATALQFSGVDYLTVAYADEGVDLRRGGISLPIMVMNPEEASFDDIIRYRLEPDIYSFRILDLFAERLKLLSHRSQYPVHVEFDTGMHRLGFNGYDVDTLLRKLEEHSDVLHVQSVFTHLACADDPAMDDFTRNQISRFKEWSKPLPGIKHILNSSGITRFTEAQLDMVRLGIGLYGISPEPDVQKELMQVSRLVTRISQIKDIPEGDTVGYNCRWRAERPSRIAIITIGYADGLHRRLGYGKGYVLINGHEAPIIGSVCMDMCFIDVTGIECNEGDRVVIFGDSDLLQRNAKAAGTIPYELLTAVSPRVKRIYYHEE